MTNEPSKPAATAPAHSEPTKKSPFVAIDAETDLPDELQEVTTEFRAAAPAAVSGGQHTVQRDASASASGELTHEQLIGKLNRWDIQAHQYQSKAELSGSFLSNLFTAKGNAAEYGLVQEAKRYAIRKTKEGHRAEFGVAVRLWIVSYKVHGEMALTIPNFAASAQLDNTEARIGLAVTGYNGALGELMPAPESLDVENFTTYTTAFTKIQALVFGKAGESNLAPTWLGYRKNVE